MKKKLFSSGLIYCFSIFVLSAQIDPRITSVLGDLSTQQKYLLELKANMLEERADQKLTDNKKDPDISSNRDSEDNFNQENGQSSAEVDILQELIFLEQILTTDLKIYEEQELVESEIDQLPVSEQLRRIESFEQINRLLFDIKQKQRDEIEKRANAVTKENIVLHPFGHKFFSNIEGKESDQLNLIPENYKVGPGDVLEILLYGKKNESFDLLINRDGIIQFPHIGPINVFEQGREFVSLKNAIKSKIKKFLGEGVQSSISLGALRSIPVFVLGQVERPGKYMVAAYSSLTYALRTAGGITDKGSLRKILLKRNGSTIGTMDLYDLLVSGDASSDQSLLAGDVVFVEPLGAQVVVKGQINLPAVYELKNPLVLSELLGLAGGISADAHSKLIKLERKNEFGRYDLYDLDILKDDKFKIIGGDIVTIPQTSPRFVQAIELVGPVERPGFYQWEQAMLLNELLAEAGTLLDDANLRIGYILRQDNLRNLEVLRFYPKNILDNKMKFELSPSDRVVLLSNKSSEEHFKDIRRILIEISKQTHNSVKSKKVSVLGEVHFPGEYLLAEKMTIHDLVFAAGGLKDSAFSVGAELTRTSLDKDEYGQVQHIRIKPAEYLETNDSKDFYLQPYDTLSVKPIPSWSTGKSVVLKGEFKFPGTYKINKGETLRQVVNRAGGLSDNAFANGAVFSRKALLEREIKEKDRMILQLEGDLANASLDALNPQEAARSQAAAKTMLSKLKSTEPTGRLVIDLNDLLKSESNDLTLKDGDIIEVPDFPSSVSVIGEVLFPSSHLFQEGYNLDDYLNMSGGFSSNADEDKIFVVKSNGSVFSNAQNKWFLSQKTTVNNIQAGDVIVVPVDIQQSRFLEQLSYSSQIIYQMAVAAAAVNSF